MRIVEAARGCPVPVKLYTREAAAEAPTGIYRDAENRLVQLIGELPRELVYRRVFSDGTTRLLSAPMSAVSSCRFPLRPAQPGEGWVVAEEQSTVFPDYARVPDKE